MATRVLGRLCTGIPPPSLLPTGAALLTFTLTGVTLPAWEESSMRLMVPSLAWEESTMRLMVPLYTHREASLPSMYTTVTHTGRLAYPGIYHCYTPQGG